MSARLRETFVLTGDTYDRAIRQLADWWGMAGRSTLHAEQVALTRFKRPSRSYVIALRGEYRPARFWYGFTPGPQ